MIHDVAKGVSKAKKRAGKRAPRWVMPFLNEPEGDDGSGADDAGEDADDNELDEEGEGEESEEENEEKKDLKVLRKPSVFMKRPAADDENGYHYMYDREMKVAYRYKVQRDEHGELIADTKIKEMATRGPELPHADAQPNELAVAYFGTVKWEIPTLTVEELKLNMLKSVRRGVVYQAPHKKDQQPVQLKLIYTTKGSGACGQMVITNYSDQLKVEAEAYMAELVNLYCSGVIDAQAVKQRKCEWMCAHPPDVKPSETSETGGRPVCKRPAAATLPSDAMQPSEDKKADGSSEPACQEAPADSPSKRARLSEKTPERQVPGDKGGGGEESKGIEHVPREDKNASLQEKPQKSIKAPRKPKAPSKPKARAAKQSSSEDVDDRKCITPKKAAKRADDTSIAESSSDDGLPQPSDPFSF
ncbi:unnamed protein product [Prorocentrum cordatum]|uniref:Uncharacterized protein n=1 Tax=Prorocentrum cordatum TaxID=2364126 RepID=A0ABN9UZJ8_9DINO|nr:unnamed protein product [Polarella glacialis]